MSQKDLDKDFFILRKISSKINGMRTLSPLHSPLSAPFSYCLFICCLLSLRLFLFPSSLFSTFTFYFWCGVFYVFVSWGCRSAVFFFFFFSSFPCLHLVLSVSLSCCCFSEFLRGHQHTCSSSVRHSRFSFLSRASAYYLLSFVSVSTTHVHGRAAVPTPLVNGHSSDLRMLGPLRSLFPIPVLLHLLLLLPLRRLRNSKHTHSRATNAFRDETLRLFMPSRKKGLEGERKGRLMTYCR